MKTKSTLLLLMIACQAHALDPNHFSITRITAPYFIVDGNAPSTITKAYVGFEVKNNSNSGTTYSNLRFAINSIGTSISGQNYSVLSPASGIVNVGTLAPGETKVCYYYVSYPAHTTAQATFNIQLSDNTSNSKTQSFNIYNRSSISANAGGTATQTITNQDIIGSIITDDVTYVVGNVQNGDENDFQVAVSSQFDPTKVTLLSTKVISSSVPGVPANATDSLYFLSGNGSNGATVTIRWTFKIVATNFTTYLLPCAGATSGATNYKYALNTSLGQGTPITVSSGSNPLSISKTSDQTLYGVNSPALFTITITNPSAYPITIDKIVDELPTGFIYGGIASGSQITATNSTIIPTTGATGTIVFEGGVNSSGNISFNVPAGGTLVLKYSALTSPGSAANLLTTVRDYIGTTEVSSAQNTVSVSTTLPLKLISFKATPDDKTVRLTWTTTNENNSSHFEIERGHDNGSFEVIGELQAAGTSFNNSNYNFIDQDPINGRNYYRLKMSDKDGNFQYSSIVTAHFNRKGFAIAVTNPFGSDIQITLTSEKDQSVSLDLTDMYGKVVARKELMCRSGRNGIVMEPLHSLPDGIYILSIRSDTEKKLIKLLKL